MSRTREIAGTATELDVVIEDAAELTAKELALEVKAAREERARLSWLHHTPSQLAARIPVSVFAVGTMASGPLAGDSKGALAAPAAADAERRRWLHGLG